MRKQTKVLVAAALFTLGASFSAFAAKSGTWVLEDAGWMCYDKSGDEYTDEFCLSYGKEYYVDDEGVMVTSSWVDHKDAMYYVGSDGQKTVSDWRLVTPADDDEADEAWYYFGANGKMVTGKKVIGTDTYYFDTDGKMLTGWVSYDTANKVAASATSAVATGLVFCDETGARVNGDWIHTWAPELTEDEQEDNNMSWYYAKSTGALYTGKALDIDGRAYLFNDAHQMLTGWVVVNGESYEAESDDLRAGFTYYFCDETDGDVKKNRWIKTWNPTTYSLKDEDNTQNWYWIGKDGKVYVPTATSSANAVTFVEGEGRTFDDGDVSSMVLKTISSKTYAFKANGQMWSGLVENRENNNMYYFGAANDGSMKTGAQVITDEDDYEYKFYFGDKDTTTYVISDSNAQGFDANYEKGVAVTGAANGYLYDNGLLVKATSAKYEIKDDVVVGFKFIVNANGAIQTSAKEYKEDGVVLFDGSADTANSITATTFYTAKAAGIVKGAVNNDTLR